MKSIAPYRLDTSQERIPPGSDVDVGARNMLAFSAVAGSLLYRAGQCENRTDALERSRCTGI